MKNGIIIALAMLLIAAFAACSNDDSDVVPKVEDSNSENPAKRGLTDTDTNTTGVFEMTAMQRAAVIPLNDFSISLFKELSQQEGVENSSVLSPLSVAILLGMLNEGASGNTCGEIQKVLGLSNKTKDDINLLMSKLVKGVAIVDPSIAVSLTNNITVNEKFTLLSQYEKALADYYQASAYSLNFSDPSSVKVINNWCNEHSKGLIPTIIDTMNPGAVAYLLNAVYFKGAWSVPFDKDNTKPHGFVGVNDPLRMAWKRSKESYYENALFEALQLPLGNGKYSMTILLPKKKDGLKDLVNHLNAEVISQMSFDEYDVETILPIFRTESETMLIPILKSMGINDAFSPAAKFPDMIQDVTNSLYVSNMWQKTSLGIDEDGCEGAAVTIAEMEVTSNGDDEPHDTNYPQRYFIADHPFLYIISEQETGAIFFVGQFCGK